MGYYARMGEARYDEMCHALDLLAKGEISESWVCADVQAY